MSYLVIVPVILMSIIIHEVSHGYVAYLLGDDTAKRAGRLSFNPIRHIDRFGTIILPILLLVMSGGKFSFGYAKPVPINPNNFKDYKKGTALSAAAGPASNFIIAIFFSIIVRLIIATHGNQVLMVNSFLNHWLQMFLLIISLNLFLGLFNLIPFPPLDGSKVIGAFLSDEAYFKYTAQERKGMMIFMLIIAASYIFRIPLISSIISIPLMFFLRLLTGINF